MGGVTPDPCPPFSLGEREVKFLHPVVANHFSKGLGKDAIVMNCECGRETVESHYSCIR